MKNLKIFMKVEKPLHSSSEDLRTISGFGCPDYMRNRSTSEVSSFYQCSWKLISTAGPQREPWNQKVMRECSRRGEHKRMLSKLIFGISCLYFILMMNWIHQSILKTHVALGALQFHLVQIKAAWREQGHSKYKVNAFFPRMTSAM